MMSMMRVSLHFPLPFNFRWRLLFFSYYILAHSMMNWSICRLLLLRRRYNRFRRFKLRCFGFCFSMIISIIIVIVRLLRGLVFKFKVNLTGMVKFVFRKKFCYNFHSVKFFEGNSTLRIHNKNPFIQLKQPRWADNILWMFEAFIWIKYWCCFRFNFVQKFSRILKWIFPEHHKEQNHSHRPQIYFIIMYLFLKYLRCHEIACPAIATSKCFRFS